MTETRPQERVEVRVPTTYVQTDETIWEDLEKLLFTGFLTSHAEFQGHHFVFKTLNHLELRFIDLMRSSSSSSPEGRLAFRSAFIAHSVVMANGSSALWDRPRHINRLVKLFSKMPASHQDKVVENLSALNDRATRTYPLTEVYVHENRSKFRWAQFKTTPLNSPTVTGMPGTELIGMNHCQLTWTALNRFLDKYDEMEKDWANAKFVGSCMAGKGIRSIDQRDQSRHERERIDREEKKMEVLRTYLNRTVGGPPRGAVETVSLPDGRTAEVVGRFRADSAQELAAQLTAALNDEKDAHDLAVESQIQHIRRRSFEVERERRSMLSSALVRPPDGDSGSRAISRGEVDTRMKRIRDSMLETRIRITPDSETSDAGSDGDD